MRDPRELKEEDPLFCMEYNYGMYKTTLSLKAVACFFNRYEIGFWQNYHEKTPAAFAAQVEGEKRHPAGMVYHKHSSKNKEQENGM